MKKLLSKVPKKTWVLVAAGVTSTAMLVFSQASFLLFKQPKAPKCMTK